MAGPFGKQTAPSNRPKRNTFDLSHQNNLTMEFGKLYPFLCEPVIPGDSVRLDTAFGIRAMPTAFPLQTKIRADVHYFYVRNRNLWKDWPDFIGQTRDDLVLPYVTNKTMPLSNGSLSDYLNIPTSFSSADSSLGLTKHDFGDLKLRLFPTLSLSDSSSSVTTYPRFVFPFNTSQSFEPIPDGEKPFGSGLCFDIPSLSGLSPSSDFYIDFSSDEFLSEFPYFMGRRLMVVFGCFNGTVSSSEYSVPEFYPLVPPQDLPPLIVVGRFHSRVNPSTVRFSIDWLTPPSASFHPDYVGTTPLAYLQKMAEISGDALSVCVVPTASDLPVDFDDSSYITFADIRLSDNFSASYYLVSPVPLEAGSDPSFSSLHISALPFRAYESIYNAFYRDDRNNPYILNGEKVYNKYLPSQDGGLDENHYILRSRNWEQDFLTTAVDSPQQGIAPLVGISSTGVASFALDDGSIEKVQLKVGDDGDTIVGAEYSNNLSPAVARQLVNVATSGISINDFRGVNALQRWLEINIRRGLKYKDQIESHFGVTPSYAELDMPEFLGGATQWFDSSQVNQTSEASSGSPLGSYAGQLSLVGGSNHPVTRFFDEHGYIIGIISISPVPVYINTLHADFLKSSPLDYFFPEFAHLGYQPIPYAQVSPLEYLREGEPVSETFGYQRAWYEYMSRTDEAHGDFRGDLRDFLLMRRFVVSPSLSTDFLTIDQKQLNQVFTVNEIDGKPIMPFLGQIHIKEIFKRPIPRYQISTLE